LIGCKYCAEAEKFLRDNNMPAELLIAGTDPIMNAGIKAITGGGQFPVLVVNITKPMDIIVGFRQEEYERLRDAFVAESGASPYRVVGGIQQPQPEAAKGPEVAGPVAGIN
jgi:glutaredoxin